MVGALDKLHISTKKRKQAEPKWKNHNTQTPQNKTRSDSEETQKFRKVKRNPLVKSKKQSKPMNIPLRSPKNSHQRVKMEKPESSRSMAAISRGPKGGDGACGRLEMQRTRVLLTKRTVKKGENEGKFAKADGVCSKIDEARGQLVEFN